MRKRVSCVHTCLVRERTVLYEGRDGKRSIQTAEEAAAFAASFFKGMDKEMVYTCVLNGKGEPVSMEMTAKGSVDWCRIDMSQLYKTAIISNGSSVICFHNHPSGDPVPSGQDRTVTEKMKRAGEMLDIPLLDHIILGEKGRYYSFREETDLWERRKCMNKKRRKSLEKAFEMIHTVQEISMMEDVSSLMQAAQD